MSAKQRHNNEHFNHSGYNIVVPLILSLKRLTSVGVGPHFDLLYQLEVITKQDEQWVDRDRGQELIVIDRMHYNQCEEDCIRVLGLIRLVHEVRHLVPPRQIGQQQECESIREHDLGSLLFPASP